MVHNCCITYALLRKSCHYMCVSNQMKNVNLQISIHLKMHTCLKKARNFGHNH